MPAHLSVRLALTAEHTDWTAAMPQGVEIDTRRLTTDQHVHFSAFWASATDPDFTFLTVSGMVFMKSKPEACVRCRA